MGGYILCQVKKAQMPYYIESISTNIYTIEELCYYLHHNIYLLDDTIINEQLCDWIRKELGLEKLYHKLYRILENHESIGNFILAVFKEINYLNHKEFKELNQELEVLEAQPLAVRQKKKGDYLVENHMYVNAIKVYEDAVGLVEETNLGEQFVGEIHHNMGCAYLNLFQIEEAVLCFSRAYEELHTKAAVKHYLIAYYLCRTPQEWEQECARMGVDPQTKRELSREIEDSARSIEQAATTKDMDGILKRLTKDYHRSTGF
jgi:tetratricopeptide (TPR) repeat protein